MTLKQLRTGIADARREADRMVASLHERTQSQETFRSELTMLANQLHALDGAEPIAHEPGAPTEEEIARLKAAVEPAGEPGSEPAVHETPPRQSRRRPALAGRKPAKHSRAAKKR